MKNLFLVLLVLLSPVWSFGQEQSDEEYKMVAKYQVCQAFEDGEDCTLRAIESDQHIVFYMNDKSSWMGIITLNPLSEKNGLVNEWKVRALPRKNEDDPSQEVTFDWYYNAKNDMIPSKCKLLVYPIEGGLIYRLDIRKGDKLFEYDGIYLTNE